MAKKRGKDVKEVVKKLEQNKVYSDKKNPDEKKQSDTSFFSKFLESDIRPKSEYRKKEEKDLKGVQWGVNDVVVEKGKEKINTRTPVWFYISSIFAAFLFVIYISIYATIHFESTEYMNMTIVFLFITMVSFFLISSIFFISEKKKWHAAAPALFFIGLASIMIYAFKSIDTSDLVRFSIMYAIIVVAISTYVLAVRK